MKVIITCFALTTLILIIRLVAKKVCETETYDRIDKWLFCLMSVCFIVGFIATIIYTESILTLTEMDF